jgi:hypothetical protein
LGHLRASLHLDRQSIAGETLLPQIQTARLGG